MNAYGGGGEARILHAGVGRVAAEPGLWNEKRVLLLGLGRGRLLSNTTGGVETEIVVQALSAHAVSEVQQPMRGVLSAA